MIQRRTIDYSPSMETDELSSSRLKISKTSKIHIIIIIIIEGASTQTGKNEISLTFPRTGPRMDRMHSHPIRFQNDSRCFNHSAGQRTKSRYWCCAKISYRSVSGRDEIWSRYLLILIKFHKCSIPFVTHVELSHEARVQDRVNRGNLIDIDAKRLESALFGHKIRMFLHIVATSFARPVRICPNIVSLIP